MFINFLRSLFGLPPRALDADGWEIPGQNINDFEDYLRGLQRNGAVEGLTFEDHEGEIEICFDVDEDMEGDIDAVLRDLIQRGLVEDVTPNSSSSDSDTS